jgi:hypothetical protein
MYEIRCIYIRGYFPVLSGKRRDRRDGIRLYSRRKYFRHPLNLSTVRPGNLCKNTPDSGSDSPGQDPVDRVRPMICPPLAKSL